jgi:hypothetical protein
MMEIPMDPSELRSAITNFPIRSMAVRQQWVRLELGCPDCGGTVYFPGTRRCAHAGCLRDHTRLAMIGSAVYRPASETEDA